MTQSDEKKTIREALETCGEECSCDADHVCDKHLKINRAMIVLSTIDPEAQAAKVGRYFCAQMPCSPSDCIDVPCRYMKDAIANRNNRDPEAIRRAIGTTCMVALASSPAEKRYASIDEIRGYIDDSGIFVYAPLGGDPCPHCGKPLINASRYQDDPDWFPYCPHCERRSDIEYKDAINE